MDETTIGLTILGMGMATYLPRLLPLLALRRRTGVRRGMSPRLETWLRQVPVAVLAAMVLRALLPADSETGLLQVDPLYLGAAVPTAWIAWKTHSLIAAVLTGTAAVALGRWVLG
jgi:branched-subunit amino acid transport protein